MFIGEIDATDEKFFGDSLTENHKEFYTDYKDIFFSNRFDYEYKIEDCAIVRTSEFFPFGGIVETPENAFASVKTSSKFIGDSVARIINKNNISIEKFKELKSAFDINIRVRRKTSHFCINGLVGSHLYGDFSSRSFIIIDTLKYHLDDIKCLRVEDTYFDDNVELSKEAAILMPSEVYDKIKDDPRYAEDLKRYKIITFKGKNENMAVGKALNMLGYDSFTVNSNGYCNGLSSSPAGSMYDFICSYARDNGYSQKQHSSSSDFIEENEKMDEEITIISEKIVSIMLEQLNKDDDYKKKINDLFNISNYRILNDKEKEIVDGFVLEYGLEKLKILIEKVNIETLNAIQLEKEAAKTKNNNK